MGWMWLWFLGVLALIVGVLWSVARGAAAQGRAGDDSPDAGLA